MQLTALDKGGVEGLIGFARRNFLVPLPRVADFEQLNRLLEERCHGYDSHRIAGREDSRTVGERFEAEKGELLALPARPFDNVKPLRVKVDRYQTVRVDRNRYSMPSTYVGRWVWAHVQPWRVRLYAGEHQVVDHPRVFSNSQWQLDPLHYLDLIRQRPGSFDSARPILQWRASWPEQYEVLLARLRKRQGESSGTREFIDVLRLHGEEEPEVVREAIQQVLELECPGYEAIRHLIRYRQQPLSSREPLPAGLIPGITDVELAQTEVSRFNALLRSQA